MFVFGFCIGAFLVFLRMLVVLVYVLWCVNFIRWCVGVLQFYFCIDVLCRWLNGMYCQFSGILSLIFMWLSIMVVWYYLMLLLLLNRWCVRVLYFVIVVMLRMRMKLVLFVMQQYCCILGLESVFLSVVIVVVLVCLVCILMIMVMGLFICFGFIMVMLLMMMFVFFICLMCCCMVVVDRLICFLIMCRGVVQYCCMVLRMVMLNVLSLSDFCVVIMDVE